MEVTALQDRIERAIREVAEDYAKTVKDAGDLKRKMNEIELSISEKGSSKTSDDIDELNSVIDRLNKLTDSMIVESDQAWKEFKNLKGECGNDPAELDRLNALRYLCERAEEFASDLLCYSLALFKRKDIQAGLSG